MWNEGPFSEKILLTGLAVLAGMLALCLLRIGRAAVVKRVSGVAEGQLTPTHAKSKAGRWTLALLDFGVVFGATWLALRAWNIDLFALIAARGGASAAVLRTGLVLALAIAAVEFVSFVASAFSTRVISKTGNRRRAAKLRTVVPLLQGLANALIVLMALSMVLSEAGVEVAPLLAGAGIAGIAIGFGAQSLVKDLFTGVFLIVEDIVSRGDVVEISGVSGTVEAMTLRTIRLRDYDGTLHIFPYGEAQVIHNKASRYSYFAFELQISYLSDIDAAVTAVQRAGVELKHDKAIAPLLLSDLEISGLDRLSDNGMILKGRIKTEAGEQWRVGRAFHPRVKRALDQAGVLISHRHLPIPPYETIDQLARKPEAPSGMAPTGGEKASSSH
jgi:small-conductance mechanosensitive channel